MSASAARRARRSAARFRDLGWELRVLEERAQVCESQSELFWTQRRIAEVEALMGGGRSPVKWVDDDEYAQLEDTTYDGRR